MNESDMQHGKNWRGQSVRGWVATEKFRGARLYWDGIAAWSRGGLCVALPAEIRAALPAGRALDCEVWAGRGPAGGTCEVEAAQAVTHGVWSPRLRLLVLDAPDVLAPYAERLAVARSLVNSPRVSVIGHEVLTGLPHLERLFAATARAGGEGLMLHHPTALYTRARVATLLKVKLDPALARGVVRDLSPIARAA